MVQGVNRVGNTLKFDNFIGAHYNVFTPSSGSVVYIDPEDTVKSGFITFHNNGQVEPQFLILDQPESVAAEKIVVIGEWVSGMENFYIGYNNGNKYILRVMQLGELESPNPNPPGVIFQDNFANLSAWTVNSSSVTFGVNNGTLTMSSLSPQNDETSGINFTTTNQTFDASQEIILVFTAKSTNQDSYGGWGFGLSNGVDAYVVVQSGYPGSGNNVRVSAAEPGAVLYEGYSKSINLTDYRKFKVKVGPNGTHITIWNPNGEFWDTIVQDTHEWSSTNLVLRASQGSNSADTNPIAVTSIGEVTVYDQDFNGETP